MTVIERILEIGDHIEMDHERELFGDVSYTDLWAMHHRMHVQGDHWNHNHWKEND